ncbi:MAG: hypothetical protein ACNS63_10660 [Candidatus Nitrospinota bacterium M3_3B_026]
MWTDILIKIDTYVFRLLGLALGIAGSAALLVNNPPEKVFSNAYGVLFLLMFLGVGLYSLASVTQEALLSRGPERARGARPESGQ